MHFIIFLTLQCSVGKEYSVINQISLLLFSKKIRITGTCVCISNMSYEHCISMRFLEPKLSTFIYLFIIIIIYT